MPSHYKEIPPEKLRYHCDTGQFKFSSTAELKPLSEIIGQNRAVEAVNFGVKVKNFGYNIFAVGPSGAGRTTAVQDAVMKIAKKMPVPDDWCYVHNFDEPDKPLALRLRAGDGKKLQKAMSSLVKKLMRNVPAALASEEFQNQKNAIAEQLQARQQNLLNDLTKKAAQKGFSIRKIANGLALLPVINGKPLTLEQMESLPEKQRTQLQQTGAALQEELNDGLQKIRAMEQSLQDKLDAHLRSVLKLVIEAPLSEVRKQFSEYPEVQQYLNHVEEDLLEASEEMFSQRSEDETEVVATDNWAKILQLQRYQVNLFVDNSKTTGAPVIIETNPTYNNLLGRLDRIPKKGMLVTNFTMIKAGSIQRANGGYLIVNAEQLFQSPLSWQALKRALKNRRAETTDLSEEPTHLSVKTLEPQPIPLDLKVILIGSPATYYALWNYDSDMQKLFKVKADFSLTMPLTRKNINNYARYCAGQCQKENLLHLTPEAMSRVIEYGVELTEDKKKLTTRFNLIRDLLVEANYFAELNGRKLISDADIKQAIEAKKFRHNKYEEQIQELFEEKTLYLDVSGERIGIVNGLTVINLGDYTLGKPVRISARVGQGQNGIIAIDREVKMSGPLHNKGVLILAGYLQGTFGVDKKLSMSASITFEQSYSTIDGDSASSAELYALLSAISGIPIKQSYAVTGSVNQMGEIQPIGGVKYKIESFFDVCRARGLTGEQGVLIPESNIDNLVLDERVVDAVREGKFHIFAVSTVEQGIEILTGKKAGRRGKSGKFPKDTIFAAVDEKLHQLSKSPDRKTRKK